MVREIAIISCRIDIGSIPASEACVQLGRTVNFARLNGSNLMPTGPG